MLTLESSPRSLISKELASGLRRFSNRVVEKGWSAVATTPTCANLTTTPVRSSPADPPTTLVEKTFR